MARTRYAQSPTTQSSTLTGKLLTIFILIMVFAVAIAAFRLVKHQQTTAIQGKTANVEYLSDREFRLTFDVTRDDVAQDSYCIVKALNYDMQEVGRRELLIPSGGNTTERLTTTITTTEAAASADVYGCATALPFYLTGTQS